MFGRKAKNPEEERILERCYKKGMENGWASGRYSMQEGDYIAEEDRLNPGSICFIDIREELEQFFKYGNWCLGQGVIYKNLFFLNQVDGGDEWAAYRVKENEIFQFESISFIPIIKGNELEEFLNRIEKATDEQLRKLEY